MSDELFNEGRLDELLDERLERAEQVVESLSKSALKRRDGAVGKVVTELAVDVPSLRRDKAKIDVAEGSPMTARVLVPYDGDAAMFGLRPTQYSEAPVAGAVLDSDHDDGPALEFVREFPVDTAAAEITAWASQCAESVEQYLYWQAADVGAHRLALAKRIEPLVDQRRERLASLGDLRAELDDVHDV